MQVTQEQVNDVAKKAEGYTCRALAEELQGNTQPAQWYRGLSAGMIESLVALGLLKNGGEDE